MRNHIHPGFAVWFTGLPASGKSTVARSLNDLLQENNLPAQLLDSDELRGKLTPEPTYSAKERDWFYEMVIFLAGLLTDNGVNVLVAATASRRAYREKARSRLERFAEVYVECPLDICRARDSKGLYTKAEKGEISTLPGIGTPYECPESPDVRVNTGRLTVEAASRYILDQLDQHTFFRNKRRR